MLEEINPAISAMAGLGCAALLLFFWNLLSAPYRLERDRADAADERISASENAVTGLTERLVILEERKGRLRITPGQIIYGGEVVDHPDAAAFAVFAYLRNIGELPMASIGWGFKFRWKDGNEIIAPPTLGDNITMDHLNINHSDFLYEKSINPIPAGGIIGGYLLSMMSKTTLENLVAFKIFCEQTDERTVESDWTQIGQGTSGPAYYPGMGNPFDWQIKGVEKGDIKRGS
ncbi:hypothetical protein AAG614_05970 [Citromicrobium bathyomarinum]